MLMQFTFCCDVTDVNYRPFIFFRLVCLRHDCFVASLSEARFIPWYIRQCVDLNISSGQQWKKTHLAKQCQILQWHVPTMNLLDRINYQTRNISHWLSIATAKYTSEWIFPAVCLRSVESKPCSISFDTRRLGSAQSVSEVFCQVTTTKSRNWNNNVSNIYQSIAAANTFWAVARFFLLLSKVHQRAVAFLHRKRIF